MTKYQKITSVPHSKSAFEEIVNTAYREAGQPNATPKEIDETYAFYRRLWDEDGGVGEISFETVNGRLEPAFGCP